MNDSTPTVLILGAGVNGVSIARELLLNGASVTIVDRADLASGASAYNSRLIHGGLRYLEYREFSLVRESLAERGRLLLHAPHLVKPLKLFIPSQTRFGGFWNAAWRFLGGNPRKSSRSRGWWLVRIGLAIYDRYTKRESLPASNSCSVGANDSPPVDANRYRWFCSYYDAQVEFPERLVIDLVADCRQIASANGLDFQLHTYSNVRRVGKRFSVSSNENPAQSIDVTPAAVVNATGASVDDSLQAIAVESKRLIGGTKGSHIITRNRHLVDAIGRNAVYAEAADGRPVFVLPFGNAVMVGTTDIPFEGDPAEAVASSDEIEYLVATVNVIFPQVALTKSDVDQHYCGVRPLPHVDAASTSSITRRHWLHRHADVEPPLYSVIGGKLTTCRQLAEDVAALVLPSIGHTIQANSRNRRFPGFLTEQDSTELEASIVERFGLSLDQVARMIKLSGSRAVQLLGEPDGSRESNGFHFPAEFVRGVIRQEQPRHLTDLVERRLMLIFEPDLTLNELRWLADLLAEEGVISSEEIDGEVAKCVDRLRDSFGKRIAGKEPSSD